MEGGQLLLATAELQNAPNFNGLKQKLFINLHKYGLMGGSSGPGQLIWDWTI